MEFINHTPFGAAAYRALDLDALEHDVLVLRTVYRLRPVVDVAEGVCWLVPHIIDEDPPPLLAQDVYSGAVGASSVSAESDLAPFKPRCDVMLSGHTHAGGARPAQSWLTRLRVSHPARHPDAVLAAATDIEPDTLAPDTGASLSRRVHWQQAQQARLAAHARQAAPDGGLAYKVLLDKTLRVHAPRRFVRQALKGSTTASDAPWAVRSGEAVFAVPLAYELAYGGASVVPNPRHQTDATQPQHLLNEVNFTNPLGCGWWHADHLAALQQAGLALPTELPAPQWEAADAPIAQPDFTPQAAALSVPQMLDAAQRYAHQPAGFGPIGRAWTPRIQLAGTYNDTWLKWSWPQLPRNFDMRHWCCAPPDQQINGFLPPDAVIELVNLVDPALCPSGHAVIDLPGHRASAVLRTASGLMLGAELVIDTVHIDTDALTLALTWRASVAGGMNVTVAELRWQTDPAAPLFAPAEPVVEPVAEAAAKAEAEPSHG